MKLLYVLISVFLISGCAGKKEIIYKCEIPNALLEVPKFSTDRELKTHKDYAILMLDIYGAYEKCALNLQSIKRINDEQRSLD